MLLRTFALPLLVLGSIAGVASDARAAAQRTFVASTGSDAYPCSIAQPCRSFSAAIAQTIAGGEVIVLDSAGYGTALVAKSVTLAAPPGVYAGITVPAGQTGVTVAAGTYDVVLRGLTILGQSAAAGGIAATHSGSLTIDRCTIEAIAGTGISVHPASSSVVVTIRDTSIARVSSGGISLSAASGTLERVTLTRVGARGISVGASSSIAVSDAVLAYVQNDGVGAEASGGQTTRVSVTNSTLGNIVGYGIFAADFGGVALVHATGNTVSGASSGGLLAQSPGAKLIATRNSVADAPWGLVQSLGATLISFGDNPAHGNTAPTSGTITYSSWQ